ncbi:hypothetical protein [Tessaracoccus antarcticus]|uniref:hypothetical protein n=1 Tax=Tessaracoccus antarcticus TaxID=2479848 RepID=UPI0011C47014|nr:hypothetical protein [Tessaracoccus antarcticus]
MALASVIIVSACSPTGALTPTSVPETPPRTTSISQSPTITETSTPTATPTPSPSVFESFPPPPADETPEQAAIRQGWMNYWVVVDTFSKNPIASDYSKTQEVTVSQSEQSKAILDDIAHLRDNGWKVVGDQVLRQLTIGTPKVSGSMKTVELTYCYDGTHRKVVSAETGIDAKIDSPDFLKEQALFEEGQDGIWRASSILNRRESC